MPKTYLIGAAAILIAVSIVACAYSIGFLSRKGTLIVKLTDSPVELTHLNITISSISIQRVEQSGEVWENLSFVEGV